MTSLVVIFVLFFFPGTHGSCPIKCSCSENAVNCVSQNLMYVPYFESLDNNPVIIDVSGNPISMIDIDDFSFEKSDQVLEIYLNRSEIAFIENDAFDELKNLQELYLNENLLNSLPEKFLENNENMILLDLSSNHFDEMPKITSESLEVLSLANSGVSKIPNDALDGLPSLRILILSQNNLKSVNPTIFNQMNYFFFVSLAYNPWKCNCKTIKLFDNLRDRKFIDLTEPVQCLTEEKNFVEIYNNKGVVPAFQQHCNNFNENSDENEDIERKLRKQFKNLEDSNVETTSTVNFTKEKQTDYLYFNFYYSLLLSVAVLVSLTIGAACGSCFTFKYMDSNIRGTESSKELLTKCNENVYT